MARLEIKTIELKKVQRTLHYVIHSDQNGVPVAYAKRVTEYFDGDTLVSSTETGALALSIDLIPEIISGLSKLEEIADAAEAAKEVEGSIDLGK